MIFAGPFNKVAKLENAMFSHPATGPLDPVRTLQLAAAHFNTDRRQIDTLRSELNAAD